ncbi:YbhB/YbcL family Raf kinase inhibitor-like protein [Methylobacterium sp. P5_C11]
MLEKIPGAVGEALSGLKAGREKTACHATFADVPASLVLTSPAFAEGAELPARFTADGEGLSPPLAWSNLPAGTTALVVLVEDAGSPTPQPLVHLILWSVPADISEIGEGALPSPGHPGNDTALGRNSFLRAAWLPPDPPTGHGSHEYVFQIYALRKALALSESPGRGALLDAMRGQVLAKGVLTGTYHRS